MISEKMQLALNKQIGLESYASTLYLAMSVWCENQGLQGCTQFMRRQSEEERLHMLKIVDYLGSVDGIAVIPAVKEPPATYDGVKSMFQTVYEHEQDVTKAIHHLVKMANEEGDFTTYNFLQWYVEEQREEEDLMRGILDRIKLIGEGGNSLYFIDKEIEAINEVALNNEQNL